ncbi:immunoglobulin domain-containing protein [Thermodesulfobacteriota bacterium]
MTAYGGIGQNGGGNGGAGTVYWKDNGQTNGSLIVDNNNLTPAEESTPLPATPAAFAKVTIKNDARVSSSTLSQIDTNMTLENYAWFTQDGNTQLVVPNLSLVNESRLTHFHTDTTTVFKIDINVTGHMNIDATSNVNVDGRGFLGANQLADSGNVGRTTGNSTTNGSSGTSGGSHGGMGGGGATGIIYGDSTNPTEPGAGGGAADWTETGGNGGGLIHLMVNGTLTNNGTISAYGNGGGGKGGGGAGGGIYVNAGAFTGTGVISANGGNGGVVGPTGGGGGGRIAIHAMSYSYSGMATVSGGSGQNGGSDGEEGTIYAPPLITTHPQSQTLDPGDTATFTVEATGTEPLTYQWKKGGVDIDGANDSSYVIASVQESDQGNYNCHVTNIAGDATSYTVTLTVTDPPVITAHPQSQELDPGATATFTIVAAGIEPLTYQWRKDGVDIDGANASSYIIESVQESDEGDYTCHVTNNIGSATSNAATLAVSRPPVITAHPQSQELDPGETATFTIVATGTEPLAYQWRIGEVDITGANGSSYSITSV